MTAAADVYPVTCTEVPALVWLAPLVPRISHEKWDSASRPEPLQIMALTPGYATWFTAWMSLIVSVFLGDALGRPVPDKAVDDSLAAGFGNWRTQVWGSPQVRALGAEYFPRLAEDDLRVEAGEVAAFLRECAVLREHLDAIAAAVDLSHQPGVAVNTATGHVTAVSDSPEVFREQVSTRLANIEAAARRALEVGGEVVIW